MISFHEAKIKYLATHFIGNSTLGESIELSKSLVDIEDHSLQNVLTQYFLLSLQQAESFHFWHPTDINLNEVYHYVSALFEDESKTLLHSISLAKHLFDIIDLPQIKSGELHVVYVKNIHVEGKIVDGIGLYKSDTRTSFLQVVQEKGSYSISAQEGFNPEKPDKACLIFNYKQDEGYQLLILDRTSKNSDAQFWKDKFLKVKPSSDDFHLTKEFLDMYKDFVIEQIPTEYEVNRVEQIDLLNKSVQYFKKNEEFDKNKFEEEVLLDADVIASFRKFEQNYTQEREIQFEEQFSISNQAVKKQSRVFKSVLKLDKNFHIYIHGDKDLIEKGYDEETGMHYYKIFFEEEF